MVGRICYPPQFSPKNISRFNTQKSTSRTINKAGGVAFSHNPEMELVMACLSTFLKDSFYEGGNERVDRIKNLVLQVDDEFVGKLAVMARNDFHLRSVSHLLIAELARKHRGDSLVSKVMEKAVERPDDLVEIISILNKKIPKQIKRGIRHCLLKFNRYQLGKYRMEGKKIKLVDLFNLAHPNPKFATPEQKQAWKDLIEGKLKSEDTWESRLSSGEDKQKVWQDLVLENKIGYMALLRNLRNISEQADSKTIAKACDIIADKGQVIKSKQLPFRFYNAYENVANQDMLEAIAEALEHSIDNVPSFDGETLVAVDCSGSMSGDSIKKASIFAAALIKANKTDVILYDTNIQEMKVLRATPVLTIAEKIQTLAMGGGTNTSLVFHYALQKNKPYSRIIILSDNESWQDSDYSQYGTNQTYNEYKKINDCFVYAIDLAGNGTKDVAGNKVFHLTGWSEKMFDFMKWIEKENQLVEFVRKIEL